MTNEQLARQLRRHAKELARNGDNLYRVRAFRRAAMVVMGLDQPVEAMLDDPNRPLEKLPGIGKSLATTIEELAGGLQANCTELAGHS